jgi:hypothetical protein
VPRSLNDIEKERRVKVYLAFLWQGDVFNMALVLQNSSPCLEKKDYRSEPLFQRFSTASMCFISKYYTLYAFAGTELYHLFPETSNGGTFALINFADIYKKIDHRR